jgi:hypothetical protein
MPPLARFFDVFHPRNDLSSSSHYTFSAVASSKGPISPPVLSRTVSFANTVLAWDHIRRDDYSAEEKKLCWFTREDYDEIRAERKIPVEIMQRGQPMINDGEHYYRGLEHKTREGSRRRHYDMIDAKIIVFEEQSQQAKRRVCDPEAVSKLYIENTAHCAASAQGRGLTDQTAVLESVSTAAPSLSRPSRLSCRAA